MLPYVILLAVLCILLLVALIVVSIQLGICKTRTNIPGMVLTGTISEYSVTNMTPSAANQVNTKLATMQEVQSATNLGQFTGTYWIQGPSSALAVAIQNRILTLLTPSEIKGPYNGLQKNLP